MKKIGIVIIAVFCMANICIAVEPQPFPHRIISLAPNITEILFALGLDDRIVGVTNFCDRPEGAQKKARVGGMSNPSLEAIVSLKPDLVIMTTDGNPREVDDRLRDMNIRTYVFRARMLHELPWGIRDLGHVLGVREKADDLALTIESSMSDIAESGRKRSGSAISGQPSAKKKVLFIVWPEPLLVAGPGTAIDDAFTMLGLDNAARISQTAYPRFSIEEVIHQAPDVLFVGRGSGMDMRIVSEGILKKLSTVPAVKNNAVCYVGDGLYRLGPRIIQGIRELSACIQ